MVAGQGGRPFPDRGRIDLRRTNDLGHVVLLAGSEGYHAAVVKRTRVGESVLVTDGRGLAVRGVAIEVTRQRLHIRVAECLRAEPRTHL